MSDISALTSQGSGQAAGQAGGTDSLMGQDTFLKLLTTQMQNQDPLSPMANEEFVAQLAQFASVEQLIGLQGGLDNIALGITSMNNAAMVDLLGQEVVATGDTVGLVDGEPVELAWDAASASDETTVHVYDADGQLVWTTTMGPNDGGSQSVSWDGSMTGGGTAEDGTYTFEVVAQDAEGNGVDTETRIIGRVDEMDYSDGTPRLSIRGVPVAVANILRLTAANNES